MLGGIGIAVMLLENARGAVGPLTAVLLGQGVLYLGLLWLAAHLASRLLGRLPPRHLAAVTLAVLAAGLTLASTFAIYHTPFGQTAHVELVARVRMSRSAKRAAAMLLLLILAPPALAERTLEASNGRRCATPAPVTTRSAARTSVTRTCTRRCPSTPGARAPATPRATPIALRGASRWASSPTTADGEPLRHGPAPAAAGFRRRDGPRRAARRDAPVPDAGGTGLRLVDLLGGPALAEARLHDHQQPDLRRARPRPLRLLRPRRPQLPGRPRRLRGGRSRTPPRAPTTAATPARSPPSSATNGPGIPTRA